MSAAWTHSGAGTLSWLRRNSWQSGPRLALCARSHMTEAEPASGYTCFLEQFPSTNLPIMHKCQSSWSELSFWKWQIRAYRYLGGSITACRVRFLYCNSSRISLFGRPLRMVSELVIPVWRGDSRVVTEFSWIWQHRMQTNCTYGSVYLLGHGDILLYHLHKAGKITFRWCTVAKLIIQKNNFGINI